MRRARRFANRLPQASRLRHVRTAARLRTRGIASPAQAAPEQAGLAQAVPARAGPERAARVRVPAARAPAVPVPAVPALLLPMAAATCGTARSRAAQAARPAGPRARQQRATATTQPPVMADGPTAPAMGPDRRRRAAPSQRQAGPRATATPKASSRPVSPRQARTSPEWLTKLGAPAVSRRWQPAPRRATASGTALPPVPSRDRRSADELGTGSTFRQTHHRSHRRPGRCRQEHDRPASG